MTTLSSHNIRRLYAWHKWMGLVTGVFLFFLAFTGAVAVFKHEIDWLVTPALRVEPQAGKASLDEVMKNARDLYLGLELQGIQLSRDARTAHVINAVERAVEKTTDTAAGGEAARWQIFADPYTGKVTGARTGETLSNVIRQTHARFYYFGFWGRVVVGAFGLALLVSTVTGLLIYGRFMKAVFARGLRFWQIRRDNWKFVTSDWHKLVGILTLAFNLVFAVTGAVLGLENLARYAPKLQRKIHPLPTVKPPQTVNPDFSLDAAITNARAALAGFEPDGVVLAKAGRWHLTVHGKVRGRFERDNSSFVLIDTMSGQPLETFASARVGALTVAYNTMEPLHFGNFAGLWLKVVYLVVGLLSSLLSVSGFVLWRLKARRRRRGEAAVVAPAPPLVSFRRGQ
jgi:uncharacterized iron-regulated membrane protein